jgi:IMP dehydrogenase
MDSVISPRTAIMLGQLGGLGVLDLEGVWTRYDDPQPLLAEIAACRCEATRACRSCTPSRSSPS